MRAVILKDNKSLGTLIWRAVKWHLNYAFTKGPMPMACGLYITSRCNFRCGFCNIWRKPSGSTISFSEAKNIIDDLSAMGCFYFSVSGGEPFLVNHLFDILAYARKSRIRYIHLVTNGYLLDEDKAARLGRTGINEISISIDGTKDFHDRNRAMPGAYDKAVKAIENMTRRAPRVKIVLNAIFSPEEPFECLHVAAMAHRFGAYAKVQPLNQHPVFDKGNNAFVSREDVSPSRIKEAVETLKKDGRVVNSRPFLDNIYNFFCEKERLIFKDSPCLFGYHHVEISEDGSVFPCLEALGWKGGYRHHGDLKGLIRSREYGSALKKLKGCAGCRRNYYICYYEPRIVFPINNFLRSTLTI